MCHIPLSAITQKCKDEAAVRRIDPINIPCSACLTQFATLWMTKSVSVTRLHKIAFFGRLISNANRSVREQASDY